MGVKGLSTFFDLNPDLSEPHKLHDTRVVIDGNNLIYSLYLNWKIECTFGGDYDRFAVVVRNYFSNFLSCNLKPYVVFDGAYDVSGKKLETVKLRTRQRLVSAKEISKQGSSSKSFLPLLAKDVLKSVIGQMGIEQVQCDFEADEYIAALANAFDCPVVSQDSDFYIFNIRGGFIRIDSIDDSVCNEEMDGAIVKCLNCTLYNVTNFLAHFPGMDSGVLPLVGTLMGNDYVDVSMFSNFFANITLPKIRKKKLKVSKRHGRLIGLMSWLQNKTPDEALEMVLARLKKNDRDTVRQLVLINIENYDNVSLERSTLRTCGRRSLPTWFSKEIKLALHSSLIVNAMVGRKLFLQVQIEAMKQHSTHQCSLPLRRILYGILLAEEPRDTLPAAPCIEEYDRTLENMKWNKISPVFDVTGYGSVPKLSTIPSVDMEDKRKLLCIIFECEDNGIGEFPENLKLLMASLVYSLHNALPKITEEFMCACLFCIIVLSVVDRPDDAASFKSNDHSGSEDSLPLKDLMSSVSPTEIEAVKQKVQKYFSKPQHSNAKKFQVDVVHNFGQVQSCALFAKCLNSLLQCPFETPRFEVCFNGTFIYNMSVELRKRKFPHQYASLLLGEGSVLDKIYYQLRKRIIGNSFG